jgi:23S rRNA pseudouridine2605 synthase
VARRADARPLGQRRWEFELTLAEGRNREVRRLCQALWLTVERLVRVRFGPVTLGDLPAGAIREVTSRERRLIDALASGASAGGSER